MYLEHFGFSELPFSITPDTSYYFSSLASREALNTLLIAARSGEGFIKITGEVGTGKTLLCRTLIASLEPECVVAYVPNPYLEPAGLFMELASELGVELEPGAQPGQFWLQKALTGRLLEINASGRRVVVCLDEALAMPIATLEALRLLSNLETEKRKLLQVIIFGQPELEEKLDHPSIRQLRQRIAFDYHLGPLGRHEFAAYLQHRLAVAGWSGKKLFSGPALWLLGRKTGRVPRLVNILAHKALLAAYGKGRKKVGFFEILAASGDTASVHRRAGRKRSLAFMLLIGGFASLGWMYLR